MIPACHRCTLPPLPPFPPLSPLCMLTSRMHAEQRPFHSKHLSSMGAGAPELVSEEKPLLIPCAGRLQRDSARKSAPRGVWRPFSSPLLTVVPSLADF